MMELIATVVITASSLFLFVYWFRYTCLLILSARTSRDYAAPVAVANQLGFLEVQSALRQESDLDRLKDMLDRDYRVLTYLLKNAANPSRGENAVENRMLEIDYRVMRVWYSMTRRISPSAAMKALEEMSQVIEHFANAMGERSAAAA
ncbi:MAG TPA: hypothetical protein VKX39_03825 [Bryobacteraceae bacterium]|jgi:hypothetical protein|nr:hypothetical protein [Bryobacteraceae bacterium]